MCGAPPNTRLKLTARVESFFSAPQLRRKPLGGRDSSVLVRGKAGEDICEHTSVSLVVSSA